MNITVYVTAFEAFMTYKLGFFFTIKCFISGKNDATFVIGSLVQSKQYFRLECIW